MARRLAARVFGVPEPHPLLTWLPSRVTRDGISLVQHVREGRIQRSLAFIGGISCLLGGLEVTYQHYRGSYGQKIMYSAPIMSFAACGACLWGVWNRRAARTVMPAVCALLVINGALGFGYHVRGVARKPGGWRLPVFNIVMGPPLFAPLLLATGAYLGLVAAFMRREDDPRSRLLPRIARPRLRLTHELREGRFQKHMAISAAIGAFLSGFEALYSHYKNNFKYKVQYTPLVTAPLLCIAAIAAVPSRKVAETALPATSLLAAVNGALGFYYHARGIKRRPGGVHRLGYNILYGPAILAPLLFSAAGFLGLLASVLRREKK